MELDREPSRARTRVRGQRRQRLRPRQQNAPHAHRQAARVTPLANIEIFHDYKEAIDSLLPGVYCGWTEFVGVAPPNAQVGRKYSSVMSIGWNPHFDNKQKTIVKISLDSA